MKKELLKKLRELKPAENLIDENDEYWSGYKDALKTMKKIVKKLYLHNVTVPQGTVCQQCGHKEKLYSNPKKTYYCVKCGADWQTAR